MFSPEGHFTGHLVVLRLLLAAVLCVFSACTNKISVSLESETRTIYDHHGHITVKVPLNRPSYRGLPIPYSPNPGEKFSASVPVTISGTAVNPTHHNLSNLILPIDGGSDGNKIEFDVNRYSINPDTEPNGYTLILTLGQPEGAELGPTPVETITILPEPPEPVVNLSSASQSITEGQSAAITIDLRNEYYEDSLIGYTITGTASPGVDHNLSSSGVFVVPAGLGHATVSVDSINDDTYETDETLILTLTDFTHARPGSALVHTLTIVDDESPPSISFQAATSTHYEDSLSANSLVHLSRASSATITVPYVVSGTATSGVDHALTNGTLSIPPGTTDLNWSFAVTNDGVYEGLETVILTLGSPTGASLGAISAHTMSLYDPIPLANFSSSTQSVSEAVGTVNATVTFTSAPPFDVAVPYTVSGTAGGSDHTLVNGTLNVLAGVLSGVISFSVTNDSLDENNETVIITLGTPDTAGLGGTNVQTITINDNDSPPTLNFLSASQTVAESVGTVTFGVSQSAASGLDVSVPYTVTGTSTGGGTDHDLAAGTVTILAGATYGGATFNLTEDALDENNETVIVTLGTPTNASLGATSVHTVTITDNDPAPSITLTAATQTVAESGSATVTVQISTVSGRAVTVPYTVAGTSGSGVDHTLSDGTLTVSAGSLTGSTTFNITADSLDEPDETIIITLGTPTNATIGATTVQTITITDDDPPPGLQFQASNHTISEGVGVATVTFTITAASSYDIDVPFTVSGTATRPADHNLANGTAMVTAGQTSGTITLSIMDDALVEGTETVIITMSTPTHATLGTPTVHTVIINDNDRVSNDTEPLLDPEKIPELRGWYVANNALVTNAEGFVSRWRNQLKGKPDWELPEPRPRLEHANRTAFVAFPTLPAWPSLPDSPLSFGWVEIGEETPLVLNVHEAAESSDCSIGVSPDSSAPRHLLEVFSLTSSRLPEKVWEYLAAKFGFQAVHCLKPESSS